ncbi:MAG TPA: hypothetical protein V6D14_25475 [Coleofasciculaceae cyanobacterium]
MTVGKRSQDMFNSQEAGKDSDTKESRRNYAASPAHGLAGILD